jgi:hypothetical protein
MNELFGPGIKPWKAYGIIMERLRVEHAETQGQGQGQAQHDDYNAAARSGNSFDGKAEEAQIESV